MYSPDEFRESDPDRLRAWIDAWPFATLVTVLNGAPVVTHVPLVLDTARGAHGTLVGHLARPNPQWHGFNGRAEAIAIFHGPHAYVSPTWYGPGPSLPTWNYTAVHAHGAPYVVEEPEAARALLDAFVARFETKWSLGGLPGKYVAGKVRGIVIFELPIERLEGKAKLSQRQSPDDRRRVKDVLSKASDSAVRDLAQMIDTEATAQSTWAAPPFQEDVTKR